MMKENYQSSLSPILSFAVRHTLIKKKQELKAFAGIFIEEVYQQRCYSPVVLAIKTRL
tara:strand:- start:320 stop:493 length:174 start_codon:yes stop_codon:yes gene_type:complete